jgi:hypothetical protein
LGGVGLERPGYDGRHVGELAGRHAWCLGVYRRSVAGEKVWACGRARLRVGASYRGGFGHGRGVVHAVEPDRRSWRALRGQCSPKTGRTL